MIPAVRGVIDRRILVNYRLDPAAAAAILPAPFEPRTVGGSAIAGVCFIRLTGMGPPGLPRDWGLSSENAAHRFAVEWDDGRRTGVYVPRRDTSSRLNALLGGHLFGSRYRHARFDVEETGDRFEVGVEHPDGGATSVTARRAGALGDESVFDSADDAAAFFEGSTLGYSPGGDGSFAGVELRVDEWSVAPLSVERETSSYFGNDERFPTCDFDSALLMEDVGHAWRRGESLCAPA